MRTERAQPGPALEVRLEGQGPGAWSRTFRNPVAVLRCKDGRGTLARAGAPEQAVEGDPFGVLDALLAEEPHLTAAGYWGYDLRYHLERLPRLAVDDLGLPDLCVGLFAASAESSRAREGTAAPALLGSPTRVTGESEGPGVFGVDRAAYQAKVRRVLDYIAAGDCYQVNLAHRLEASLENASAAALFQRLRAASPAPYAAYLDCGDHQVLSSSPELFLRVAAGRVVTRPIKGTRPRGGTPSEDAAHAAELLGSAKDRAELVMIVDLERNDLGRVCEYGSVRVARLCELESFAQVHHLVATVEGRLRPGVTPLQALRAAFPGGSITGAPKIRAMEIIEELEPVRRGVYTGAIGWVDGAGNGEWNIAIRTIVVKDGRAYFHVGGGIVADSDPAAEYAETLAKAQGMLAALPNLTE
jgi:para-aminobenzoate synthetase component 1